MRTLPVIVPVPLIAPSEALSVMFPLMPALIAPIRVRFPAARLIEMLPSLLVKFPDPMTRLFVSLTVSDSPESLIRATSVVIFVLSDDVVLAVTLRILPVIVPVPVIPPANRESEMFPLLVVTFPDPITKPLLSKTVRKLWLPVIFATRVEMFE